MIHANAGRPDPATPYMLVQVDGSITAHNGTFRDMSREVRGRHGETGLEDVPNCYPLVAYHFVPYEEPAQERVNYFANAIFWELSEPGPDGAMAEPYESSDRVVKMRGPVGFSSRDNGLTEAQIEAITAAHQRFISRLQSMSGV